MKSILKHYFINKNLTNAIREECIHIKVLVWWAATCIQNSL